MRKHTPRRTWIPLPPRGLRPRLTRDQVRDLALAHVTNLDDVASGRATADVMWQMAGGVLTWSRVAQLTGTGVPEMAEQLEMMAGVVMRFAQSGRVGFSGIQYQTAKRGVEVMDALAEIVDVPVAMAAAQWSEAAVNRLQADATHLVYVMGALRTHTPAPAATPRAAPADSATATLTATAAAVLAFAVLALPHHHAGAQAMKTPPKPAANTVTATHTAATATQAATIAAAYAMASVSVLPDGRVASSDVAEGLTRDECAERMRAAAAGHRAPANGGRVYAMCVPMPAIQPIAP